MRRLHPALFAAGFGIGLPVCTLAAPLYTEDYDVDHTANWKFNSSTDGAANFFFDYSTVGIPSAPHSAGGTTRGLKMEANIPGTGVFSGMSASPIGQHFSGDYMLTFDCWPNMNGPMPGGGNGSTQVTHGGLFSNENTAQFPGGTLNGMLFGATGDGGSANDYRAYPAGALLADTSGAYAAGNVAGVSNNSNAYYNTFGGVAAPAAQTGLFPQQTGNTAVGTQALAWHFWEIAKTGNIITWKIDTKLIATADVTGKVLGGDDIFVGQFDINATSSTDVNARSLLFGLVDNISVDAVPEPGSAALLGLLGATLLCRRRRSSAILDRSTIFHSGRPTCGLPAFLICSHSMREGSATKPISFTAQMTRAILEGTKTQTRRIASANSECPFGAVGDHLWVREPWAQTDSQILYAADTTERAGIRWRASYLMQRDISRITLQIMAVRIERLHKISAADAIAEGCPEDRASRDPIEWFAELWDKMCSDPPDQFEANPHVWVIEFRNVTPRQA